MAQPQAKWHELAWMIAGGVVLMAVVISLELIYRHLLHMTQPLKQRKIVGILWLVPIYALDSWLSLRFKDLALYLDMCRDCYESYVIYLFLALMISYLGNGDEEKVVAICEALPPLSHPFPFHLWNSPIQLDREFIRHCKLATMQFVVIKPLLTLLAIVLDLHGLYDEGHFSIYKGYLYTTLVMNASISYAFYYLVLFYLALSNHLQPYHPVPKFLCIKAVLFLSFWQGVLLAFLAKLHWIHAIGSWTTHNVATGIQNLLICVEMLAAAIAHRYAFGYEEYVCDSKQQKTRALSILSDNLALEEAVRDFNQVMPIVLPSKFRPGEATIVDRDQCPSPELQTRCLEQYHLLSNDLAQAEAVWKLDESTEEGE